MKDPTQVFKTARWADLTSSSSSSSEVTPGESTHRSLLLMFYRMLEVILTSTVSVCVIRPGEEVHPV